MRPAGARSFRCRSNRWVRRSWRSRLPTGCFHLPLWGLTGDAPSTRPASAHRDWHGNLCREWSSDTSLRPQGRAHRRSVVSRICAVSVSWTAATSGFRSPMRSAQQSAPNPRSLRERSLRFFKPRLISRECGRTNKVRRTVPRPLHGIATASRFPAGCARTEQTGQELRHAEET